MWLGWLVGVPMLLWTVSGLIMVARPIEEVRGTDLLGEPNPVSLAVPLITPRIEGRAVQSLALEPRAIGARWVVTFAGEPAESRVADPGTGTLLAPLGAADAVREVSARYTGTAKVEGVSRIDPAKPPVDFRQPIDAWRVRMSDGVNFYVGAGSARSSRGARASGAFTISCGGSTSWIFGNARTRTIRGSSHLPSFRWRWS